MLALAIAGCGGGGGGGAQPRPSEVVIVQFSYAPAETRIAAGGAVEWVNEDPTAHTATLDDGSLDTGSIESGEPASLAFDEPGTYPYHCDIHPSMKGVVEVN